MAVRRALEWIGTLKARLSFWYEIPDLLASVPLRDWYIMVVSVIMTSFLCAMCCRLKFCILLRRPGDLPLVQWVNVVVMWLPQWNSAPAPEWVGSWVMWLTCHRFCILLKAWDLPLVQHLMYTGCRVDRYSPGSKVFDPHDVRPLKKGVQSFWDHHHDRCCALTLVYYNSPWWWVLLSSRWLPLLALTQLLLAICDFTHTCINWS